MTPVYQNNMAERIERLNLQEISEPQRFFKKKLPVINVSTSMSLGRWISPVILLVVDYIAVLSALSATYHIRKSLFPHIFPSLPHLYIPASYIYFIIPAIYLGFLAYERMYTKRLPIWKNMELIFNISLYSTVFVIGLIYFTGQAKVISRSFILISGIMAFCFLNAARYIAKRILLILRLWQKPVIIIGERDTAGLIAQAFREELNLGYEIAGFIEAKNSSAVRNETFILLEKTIRESGVEDVIIAAPGLRREELLQFIYKIQPMVKRLSIVPNLFGIPMSNLEIESLFSQKAVLLTMQNNLTNYWNRLYKRIFDLIVGSVILVLVLPLMVVIGVIIKLDSPGPVLHSGRRIGKGGKEFRCYKFRTMLVNNDKILTSYLLTNAAAREEWERFAKLKHGDPRLTRVGRWLRKWSLDELPQIFNILKGDMSLVGPRPYLVREKENMSYYFNTIVETVPGITGLWQVSGRNNIDFAGRLNIDTWYVRNWSIWIDISLLLKTFKVVLERKGAY